MTRRVRVALAAGLALVALALLLTLSSSPAVVAPTPPRQLQGELVSTQHSSSLCQPGETVPAGTTAIRFTVKALIGPPLTVRVFAGGRLLTSGVRSPGWTGGAVIVPVGRVGETVVGARVCLAFPLHDERVTMTGAPSPAAQAAVAGNGQALPGRIVIEYLSPGARSWWSLAPTIARRLGLGRAWAGTWNALLALLLMAAALALTVWRVLRMGASARGRVPAAAWACALVACLNAAAWSIVTPPFQVPDEVDHFAYAQQLVLGGRPPSSNGETRPSAQTVALLDLSQFSVRLEPENHPIYTQAEQQQLQTALVAQTHVSQHATGQGGVAAGEPPLYYALQAIPYSLIGGTVLERLALMRLLSALLAGVTALLTFLFVREALPGVAWAWTVGALSVALVPLFGFMSGGVNPDALLFAVSAALFYCLARAFRRGLTPRLGLAIGSIAGIGLASKLNFIGLLPGTLLGLFVLTLRARARSRREAARSLALALGAIAAPVVAVIAVDVLSHRPPFGPAIGQATTNAARHGTLLGEIVYVWQLYLPRLPGMARDFTAGFAPREIWFNGYVGLYGWLDTTFPPWVYNVAIVPAVAIAALCARGLLIGRAALRGRVGELVVYGAIAVGLLLLLGVRSYEDFPQFGASFGEARYLLPLLPLLGAALALAARAGGRRWGPVLGTLIVVLALAHDGFSQLLEVARYYYH
jgi:4-amino-4-deoxy-L-arabinose transferase-like glycosyltransferase